jgi:hypothetical protein
MGLDATIYCNCFETNTLRESPPYPDLVFVTRDGSLNCKSEDLKILLEFDQWLIHRACEHEDGVLLHHRIGNIALVSLLHSKLSHEAEKFPVIMQKILYSGSHAGDYLSLDIVERLKTELDFLDGFVCSSARNQEFFDEFRQKLIELVETALEVKKPISF